jgi:hypothetical protein
MASKIHGKQIKDTSISLAKISPITGQVLTLAGTTKIQQNALPTIATDLTNKQYVDSVAAGFDPKASVRVATTGNINLASAPATIDGVSLSNGDRVLVWQQSSNTENGIYDYNGSGSAMTRSTDMDGAPTSEVSTGNNTFVTEGPTYQGNGYVVIASGTWSGNLTVGVAPIVWTQFSGAGSFVWGDGISNTGNNIFVDLAGASGLTFSANKLTVDSNIAGSGLSFLSGVLNVNTGSGLTITADNVVVDYSTVGNIMGGAGLTVSGNTLGVGAGSGISVGADSVAVDYNTVGNVMGGAGLTVSGNTLGVGSGNTGILVTADGVGLSMSVTTDSSLSLIADGLKLNRTTLANNMLGLGTSSSLTASAGNLQVLVDGTTITRNVNGQLVANVTDASTLAGAGLTSSGNVLNILSGNTGILVTADAVGLSMSATTDSSLSLVGDGLNLNITTLATNLEGTGLTSSAGKLNVVTGTGITISGDAITTNAALINTTAYLNTTNVATGSSVQAALSAIDTALAMLSGTIETISVSSNPTGTFLASVTTPVAINTGVTYSRLSSGEAFVFVNGVSYGVGNSGTASDFFFAATTSYSGSLTASSTVYVGSYLWSTVSALGFDLDTTDEVLVKYNAY